MDVISQLPNETVPPPPASLPDTTLSRQLALLRTLSIVWLGVVLGVHAMFSALLLLGFKLAKPSEQAIFTDWGRELFHPERDIPLYVLFCGLTFVACAGMMRAWNRRYAAIPPERRNRFTLASSSANLMLALAATVFNPIWFFTAKRIATMLHPFWIGGELVLLLPLAVEAWLFWKNLQSNGSSLPRAHRLLETALRRDPEFTPLSELNLMPARFAGWNWRDALFIALIWLFFYSPRPDVMAGFIFQSEHFHHWDYFVTGPALGYLHGQALCTEVYSQYGIGFPLLFALLNPIYRLSYGHIIEFTNIFTCLYLCGVYGFLRLLLRSPFWAAFGTFLLSYYKLFIWTSVWFPPFQLPSNTVLRAPFDIWFLLALLLHQRSQKMAWLLASGALAGLSLLFETDTGVYICFTFGVYCLFHVLAQPRSRSSAPARSRMAEVRGAGIVAFGVLLSGMAIASRGTLFTGAFWRGWIECFTAYPNGISMMPVAEHLEGMSYGMLMVGIYLFALCYHFHRWNERRSCPDDETGFQPDLLLMSVALYGTCTLLHFMGRSHPTNLYVGSMACTLLFIIGLHTLTHHLLRIWQDRLPVNSLRLAAISLLAVFGLLTYWHDPNIRSFPSYVRLLVKKIQPREITLFIDEAGNVQDPHQGLWPRFVPGSESAPLELYPGSGVSLPQSFLPKLQRYTPVVEDARRMEAQGKKIAILANDETWMVMASGATPWYRYSPLYPNIITKAQLENTKSALLTKKVDYVFIEAAPPLTTFVAWHPLALFTTDVWRELRQFTAQHYTFDHIDGIYEVWRRQ